MQETEIPATANIGSSKELSQLRRNSTQLSDAVIGNHLNVYALSSEKHGSKYWSDHLRVQLHKTLQ